MNVFKELYHYREFLKTNIKKEIRGKYKASFLGVLWSFINPLLQVVVYAIVFPYIMRGQTIPNYLLFIICGIIPWTWFTMSLLTGTTCITANSNLIKKVYFPREILPISTVTSGAVNFLISCLIIIIFAIFTGSGITWHVVFLPLIMLVQYFFSLALVFITCAINVFVKDVEYAINFVVNLLFYATPILYPATMFADTKIAWIFKLNPMAYIVEAYKNIFYVHTIPGLKQLFGLLLISIVLVIICYSVFKKLSKRFAEEI